MIVRIFAPSCSILYTLRYNLRKVDGGEASVLHSANIDYGDLPFSLAALRTLYDYESMSQRTSQTVFHASINPAAEDNMSDSEAARLAEDIMAGLGYAAQPWILFLHEDIQRKHYHLLSVRVDRMGNSVTVEEDMEEENGSKDVADGEDDLPREDNVEHVKRQILAKRNEYRRCERICRALAEKYHYVYGRDQNASLFSFQAGVSFDRSKGHIISQFDAIAEDVARNYYFPSLNDYAYVMGHKGVKVFSGKLMSATYKGKNYDLRRMVCKENEKGKPARMKGHYIPVNTHFAALRRIKEYQEPRHLMRAFSMILADAFEHFDSYSLMLGSLSGIGMDFFEIPKKVSDVRDSMVIDMNSGYVFRVSQLVDVDEYVRFKERLGGEAGEYVSNGVKEHKADKEWYYITMPPLLDWAGRCYSLFGNHVYGPEEVPDKGERGEYAPVLDYLEDHESVADPSVMLRALLLWFASMDRAKKVGSKTMKYYSSCRVARNSTGWEALTDREDRNLSGMWFAGVEDFSEGFAIVRYPSGMKNYLTLSGELLLEEPVMEASPFRGGQAQVLVGDRYVTIDRYGQEVRQEMVDPWLEGYESWRENMESSHEEEEVWEEKLVIPHETKEDLEEVKDVRLECIGARKERTDDLKEKKQERKKTRKGNGVTF